MKKAVVLVMFVPVFAQAANVYIDLDATHNGDGSAGFPAMADGQPGAYNSVHSPAYNAANDYWFKCGTNELMSETEIINGLDGSLQAGTSCQVYPVSGGGGFAGGYRVASCLRRNGGDAW